jgi:hypothetical protein
LELIQKYSRYTIIIKTDYEEKIVLTCGGKNYVGVMA